MRNIVTHISMRSSSRRSVAEPSRARTEEHSMHRCPVLAVSDPLDDERSPISPGEGMQHLMTRITSALFDYVKDLVRRAPIASITEWPMHREW